MFQVAGNSFEDAIDAETSGNLHDAYRAIAYIAQDHFGYYAQKLNDAVRGFGTDDAALIRHVVGRSEVSCTLHDPAMLCMLTDTMNYSMLHKVSNFNH